MNTKQTSDAYFYGNGNVKKNGWKPATGKWLMWKNSGNNITRLCSIYWGWVNQRTVIEKTNSLVLNAIQDNEVKKIKK